MFKSQRIKIWLSIGVTAFLSFVSGIAIIFWLVRPHILAHYEEDLISQSREFLKTYLIINSEPDSVRDCIWYKLATSYSEGLTKEIKRVESEFDDTDGTLFMTIPYAKETLAEYETYISNLDSLPCL